MPKNIKSAAKWLLPVLLTLVVAACSGGVEGIGVRKVAAKEAVAVLDQRVIIDVRSASEAAAGALVGATVLDYNSGEFEAKIRDYDRNAAYLVYCRSGHRSGLAAARMKELGFTDVIDAGAYADLVAAGAATTP